MFKDCPYNDVILKLRKQYQSIYRIEGRYTMKFNDILIKLVEEVSNEEFFKKLQAHDWTYMMSDDHRKWQIGRDQEKELQTLAKDNPTFEKMYKDYSSFVWKKTEKPKLEDYLD